MGAALLFADALFQRVHRVEAQCSGKGVVQRHGLLLLHGVQGNGKLCRFAGKLRHPELGGVGKIEPEILTCLVAVDRIFGGGHQLAGAQHHRDVFHPAVRDGDSVQKPLEIQRYTHPACSGQLHRHKGGMGAGEV